MEFSKLYGFFPNECIVCQSSKSTNIIRRCKCNMISYCGKDHQLQDWPTHKSFCNAISEILKEKKLSHIFENHPSDLSIWIETRERIIEEVQIKLGRPLNLKENAILLRPRVCYVCREANQEQLKNCPHCPIASFCKLHPTSDIHNKNCPIMRRYLDFIITAEKLNIDLQFLSPRIQSIAKRTAILRFEDPLTSTIEFCDKETQIKNSFSRCAKSFLPEFFSFTLKLSTALEKVYDTIPSEIIIHLDMLHCIPAITRENYWEFLLHLNPDIKNLKVVVTGSRINYIPIISLCEKCRSMKKTMFIEIISMRYEQYMLQKNDQKPNILSYLYMDDLDQFRRQDSAEIKRWSQIRCPIVLTTPFKREFHKTLEILESSSGKFHIIYEGITFKKPLIDGILLSKHKYMIICKSMGIITLSESRDDNSNAKGDEDTKSKAEEIESRLESRVDDHNVEGVEDEKLKQDEEISESPGKNYDSKGDEDKKLEAKEIKSFLESHDDFNAKEGNDQEMKSRVDNYNAEGVKDKGHKEVISDEIESRVESHVDDSNAKGVEDEVIPEKIELLSESRVSNYNTGVKSKFIKSPSESVIHDSKEVTDKELNAETKNLIPEVKEIIKKNHVSETKETTKDTQVISLNSGNLDSESHLKLTLVLSFLLLLFYIFLFFFLSNEIMRLREHFDLAIGEVENLQNKILELQEIYSKLVGKINLIKETARDIEECFSSALKKNIL